MIATTGAALALGFLGSSHCFAMCGGIAGAFAATGAGANAGAAGSRTLLANAGRLSSYAAAGALAGGLGGTVAAFGGANGLLMLRGLAALLLVGAGLAVAGGPALLAPLEKAGGALWRRVAPLAAKARASRSAAGVFAFGALWGWLPCGLVYSALGMAGTSGSAASGALSMAAFALGTFPATLGMGLAASRGIALLRGPRARRVAGTMLVLFGAWTLGAAVAAGRPDASGKPACHHHAEAAASVGN